MMWNGDATKRTLTGFLELQGMGNNLGLNGDQAAKLLLVRNIQVG
jgi:hypothetical protein